MNIQGSSVIQKPSSIVSIMLCAGATLVKKNSCLVARIVSFDVIGLYLLIFRILEPYPSKDILTLTLSWRRPLSYTASVMKELMVLLSYPLKMLL